VDNYLFEKDMSMRLKGKVAIITGGSKGIGLSTAKLFIQEGAKVIIANRNKEEGKRALDKLLSSSENAEALFVPTDVSIGSEVTNLIEQTITNYSRINILVNNAASEGYGGVMDIDESDWDRVMAVNLKGPFLCSKHVIPHIRNAGGGTIINTASVCGLVGFRKSTHYCTSKGGLVAFTRHLALDLAPFNIRVNCVCPAFVDTEVYRVWLDQHDNPEKKQEELIKLLPLGRMGNPIDVAYGILYLASDESSWVTGHTLVIDGGYLAQ
jgi:NAD(P)-dependent dehydrogenase (short-subunit alcohol dehydrogenase family)